MTGWWFQTWLLFSIMYGIILPIDFHIFQDGFLTTNQMTLKKTRGCLPGPTKLTSVARQVDPDDFALFLDGLPSDARSEEKFHGFSHINHHF